MCMSGGSGSSARTLRSGQLGVQRRGVKTQSVSGYDLQKAGWYNESGNLVSEKLQGNKDYKYSKGVKFSISKGRGRFVSSVKDGATRTYKTADLSNPIGTTEANPMMPAQTQYAKKTVTQTYQSAKYNAVMKDDAQQRIKVDDGSQARRKARNARMSVANVNTQSRVSGKRAGGARGGFRISTGPSAGVQVPGT